VNDGVGAHVEQQSLEPVVLFGEVEVHEVDLLARQLLPDSKTLADGTNWCQGLDL
jgi:hypothetical protein